MEGCVAYEHTQVQEPVYQEIDQIATQEEMYDVYNYGHILVGIEVPFDGCGINGFVLFPFFSTCQSIY